MDTLKPKYSIKMNETFGEVHFTIAGFWDVDAMWDFQHQLTRNAQPLHEANRPIHVLGDLTDFVPQSRQTSEAISKHLAMSRNHGLKRIAIINPSSLVRDQYRRLSSGIEVEFFTDRFDAVAWLRRK